jgi:hypothetical protein
VSVDEVERHARRVRRRRAVPDHDQLAAVGRDGERPLRVLVAQGAPR